MTTQYQADSAVVDELLATKTKHPKIAAVQRYLRYLRGKVGTRAGFSDPTEKHLVIRRSLHPGKNSFWVGAAQVELLPDGSKKVEVHVYAPGFVQVVRDEALTDQQSVPSGTREVCQPRGSASITAR